MIPEPTTSTEPIFSRIALSMSGGGFRATTYGLGTLNTLYLLGVLDNVHMLSTISGGTIAGAYYAYRLKQGIPFPVIYEELFAVLDADEILPQATQDWKKALDESNGDYKIIRSFADVYDQMLFHGTQFGLFWEPDAAMRTTTSNEPSFPLQTLIFGATELYSGLAFRFQYSTLPESNFETSAGEFREWYYIGNGNIRIPHSRARELRLSDIVASSSCLPVGFEALNLPNDFNTDNPAPMPFRVRGNPKQPVNEVALVDGGVYDNQGIESLVLANQRNQTFLSKQNSVDLTAQHQRMKPSTLFLVADVASAEMGIYQPDETPPARSGPSLASLLSKGKGLLWAGVLLAIIGIGLSYLIHAGGFIGGFVVGIAVIVGLIGWGVRVAWQKTEKWMAQKQPGIFPLVLPPLGAITPLQLVYLIKVRIKMAVTLLLTVFLRRVRSLNYGLLYRDDDTDVLADVPAPDVISSIIGSLLRDVEKPDYKSDLSMLTWIAEKASSMSTTLWWLEEKNKMRPILACAEITLTWRIKRLIARKRKAATDKKPFVLLPADEAVLRRAELIFETFQLANDKSKPATYLPTFRLYPGMKTLIDNMARPDDLIDFARNQPD